MLIFSDVPTKTISGVEPWIRWVTAAEEHTAYHPVSWEQEGYNSHRLTKSEQQKTEKTLADLMSPTSDARVINILRVRIHPASYQQFRLLAMTWHTSQTGFLTISLYSHDLHRHRSPTEHLWQISSICMTQSCPYGPESQRNVESRMKWTLSVWVQLFLSIK